MPFPASAPQRRICSCRVRAGSDARSTPVARAGSGADAFGSGSLRGAVSVARASGTRTRVRATERGAPVRSVTEATTGATITADRRGAAGVDVIDGADALPRRRTARLAVALAPANARAALVAAPAAPAGGAAERSGLPESEADEECRQPGARGRSQETAPVGRCLAECPAEVVDSDRAHDVPPVARRRPSVYRPGS
jgi:hypothetical protein